VFSGVTDYTRRGDFQVNANGNLVNGAGYYLMGVDVDPKTGNPTGNVPHVLQFQNNFIPAQATSAIQYGANLPTQPKTPASSTAASGTLTADGGINPADFASNPLPVGTPAAPFTDNTITGSAALNQAATPAPITAATALSGTAPSNSLPTSFANGDTITVDGTTIHFVTTGTNLAASPPVIDITDNVGTLLTEIGNITGVAPTINASTGAITLHTGTANNLNITSSSAAFTSLGFSSPVTAARGGGGTAGTGVVTGNDLTTFTNESISGGAVTAYNAAGTPVNMQLRWAKTDSAALGTGHQDAWNLFYQTSTTATGTGVVWVNTGTNFVFSANGSLSSPTGSSISVPGVTVDGQSLGTLSVNISSGALTQFATTSGAATINTISQNGFAAGQLQSVAINNSGIVVGTFSNGQNIDLAAVTLSHFNGTNYLKALDGGAYEVTDLSGPAISGASGKISGSSLEGSNTDIADEFTKLIVTQQAYSANTKVITTANNMVQDLLNVLR
jgi:flagellar hook protein FlgE